MKKDTIFRGLMRPQTFFGIPMIPFILVNGFFAVCFFAISKYFIFLLPISFFIMRLMIKKDELIFDLIFARFLTWKVCKNAKKIDRQTVIVPSLPQ